MSNLGPIQTNGATEATLQAIELLLQSGLPTYAGRVNQYGEILVPFNTETTILTYVVPVGQTFYILGMNGWGDTNGEFFIKVDGNIVGGDRTTAAVPSCRPNYQAAPIPASAGSVVTISVVTYVPTTHIMRAIILGGIV